MAKTHREHIQVFLLAWQAVASLSYLLVNQPFSPAEPQSLWNSWFLLPEAMKPSFEVFDTSVLSLPQQYWEPGKAAPLRCWLITWNRFLLIYTWRGPSEYICRSLNIFPLLEEPMVSQHKHSVKSTVVGSSSPLSALAEVSKKQTLSSQVVWEGTGLGSHLQCCFSSSYSFCLSLCSLLLPSQMQCYLTHLVLPSSELEADSFVLLPWLSVHVPLWPFQRSQGWWL